MVEICHSMTDWPSGSWLTCDARSPHTIHYAFVGSVRVRWTDDGKAPSREALDADESEKRRPRDADGR